MSEFQTAVMLFRPELEMIEATDVKAFLQNALSMAPKSFIENSVTIEYTKKVFKVLNGLLEQEGTRGMLRDIMLSSVLLSDLCLHEMPEGLEYLHGLHVGKYLQEIQDDLPVPVWEGLMNMIDSHEGKVVSAALDPKAGTPGFMVALAHRVVRLDGVKVEL